VPQGKKANSNDDTAGRTTTLTSIIPGISSNELVPVSLSGELGAFQEGVIAAAMPQFHAVCACRLNTTPGKIEQRKADNDKDRLRDQR
jgi:hypothetical protein